MRASLKRFEIIFLWVRKLAVPVAAIAVLVYLLNAAIDNPYTHRFIRSTLDKKLSEYTELRFDFRAIKASLVMPGVDLFGVSVHLVNDSNKTLLKASRMRLRLSVLSLFLGKPKLSLFELTDLDMTWPPNYEMISAISKMQNVGDDSPVDIQWPPKFDLPISHFVLRNANVSYDFRDDPVGMGPAEPLVVGYVQGLDVDFIFRDWAQIYLGIQIGNGGIEAAGIPIINEAKVSAELFLTRNELSSQKFSIQSKDLNFTGNIISFLNIEGKPPRFMSVDTNIRGEVDGDLRQLGTTFDIPNTYGHVRGDAEFALHIPVMGKEEFKFGCKSRAQVTAGAIDEFKLHNSIAAMEIDLEKILFKNISVVLEDRTAATARGSIDFSDELRFKFNVHSNDLTLNEVLKSLNVDFSEVDFGIVSDDLEVSGMGEPFKLKVAGLADLRALDLKFLKFDDRRFKLAPDCRMQIDLFATGDWLDFGRSKGTCYKPKDKKYNSPKSLDVPENALSPSPLYLLGRTTFDDRSGMDLRISSTDFSLTLAEYWLQQPLAGAGPLNVRIFGPYSTILTDITADLKQASVAGVDLGQFVANARVDSDKISWSDVKADFQSGYIVSKSGSLWFSEGNKFNLNIDVKGVDQERIHQIVNAGGTNIPLSFYVDKVNGSIKGNLLLPLMYQSDLTISLKSGVFDKENIFDSLNVDVSGQNEGSKFRNLRYRAGQFIIGGSIEQIRKLDVTTEMAQSSQDEWIKLGLSLDDEVLIDLRTVDSQTGARGQSSDTDHLQTLPFAGKYLNMANLKGLLDTKIKLQGSLRRLQGTFQVTVNQFSFLGSPMAPIRVQGFANGSAVETVINQSGNALEGKLQFDFLEDGIPYEIYFQTSRFDLRALGTEFFYRDPRNYAYLSSTASLKGRFTEWWKSTGAIDLKDLRIRYVRDGSGDLRDVELSSQRPLHMDLTEKGWEIANGEQLSLSSSMMKINVDTTTNLPPDHLNVGISGELDMRLFSYLFTEIESASGKLRFQSLLSGSIAEPKFSLSIEDVKANQFTRINWEPVSLGIADLRPPLKNIEADIELKNGQLNLKRVSAEKGNGKITANGVLNLGSQDESRIDIMLKNAAVVYPVAIFKSFESSFDGNISITGKELPLRIGGEIRIVRARSTGEFDLRKEIFDAIRKRTYRVQSGPQNAIVELDLNVRAAQSVTLNNRTIQATLSTNLQISGTDASPVVSGVVEINKGKFVYKRDFKVTQGLITFDDPVRLDPKLDIMAECDVSSYRVFVTVTGQASDPRVELSVEPPTREDGSVINKLDIISLLSSGNLPTNVANNAGNTQSVAQAEALNIFVGQFEEPVEKLFDLSGQNIVKQVYIDTYPNEEGTPVPRFNVPLNFGDNWDTVFRVDEDNWALSSEYYLHDNISLLGSLDGRKESDQAGATQKAPTDTGVDLKFRFAFP